MNQLTKQETGTPKSLKSIQNFAEAIALAHGFYTNKDSIFVIVADHDNDNINVLDMEALVPPLAEKGIVTRVYTFEDIYELGTLDEETGVFSIMEEEVAIFYLRTGYNPEHYSVNSWECRRRMELSNSIVCPDIDAQITNLKYI